MNSKYYRQRYLNGLSATPSTDIISESNQGETIQVTSPQITIIPYNTKLKVLGKSRNWTKVNYNGTQG